MQVYKCPCGNLRLTIGKSLRIMVGAAIIGEVCADHPFTSGKRDDRQVAA